MKNNVVYWWSGRASMLIIDAFVMGFLKKHYFPGCTMNGFFFYSEKYKGSGYLSKASFDEMIKSGKEFFNQDFVEEYFKLAEDTRAKFFDIIKNIRNSKVSQMSNEELANLFWELYDCVMDGAALYCQSQQEPLTAAENRIKEIVKDENKMLTIVEPYELDDINNGEVCWYNLLGNKDEISRDDIIAYLERFSWHMWNMYDLDDAVEYYKNKFLEDKKTNYQNKAQEIIDSKDKHKKKVMSILDEFNNEELNQLVSLFHRTTIGRMRLKPVWAGADFLASNLIKEIAKRLESDVVEFVFSYRIKETVEALKKGELLTKEEIIARKKSYLIGFKDYKEIFVSGKEAKVFVKEEYPELFKENNEEEVKGTIVSKGKHTGRVRIILSENIEKVKELSKTFEKGDVLVTDMTQPNMMVLIGKAGAIVTNEGGITSHAAVVSREFKIPCIVGTHRATLVFKDGDRVEVDADKGIVRKIN